ncbi:hypothetical protein ALO97_03651 [Pseudomonas syringae pv. tagetis]|uniref:DUF1795 domain-containing protein n=2 Tax=Pseudomonas syringae pv. tagetis TaxID=129140 RepID=A0A0Q0HB26_9PSED|nr:Uncharacterized protein ALO44_03161 [Pseudomonas syringae pv. tagetis]RMW14641.1 hypothetical protein ALO98_01547 [Pseudomonas syringae pv. tagetis]RMW28855.1 hypothetical protein ALO97_03651 [Pseudomonas syringae pv. tagetis]
MAVDEQGSWHMRRTSLYDRISERRLADEALAREEAERAAAQQALDRAEALIPVPKPLLDAACSFNFGGFRFSFPEGFRCSAIDATVQVDGEPVAVSIQRRDVPEEATLAEAFAEELKTLRPLHGEVQIIRHYETLLAGNAALALDFHFRAGLEERHGRLIGSIVPVADHNERQWLSVGCVIDSEKPALQTWLLDFDSMLEGLTAP